MKTLICTALVCLVQGAAFAQGAPPSAHPQPPSDAPPPPTPPPHAEVVDEVYKVTVGGEEVEVHLKPLTVRATTVAPDNGTGGFFNRLEPDARKGNDDAAHALYRSLETCKPFPKSRAELNASVEQGRAKWAATGGVQAPGDKPQDFDKWAQHQEAMFHRCEGVNDAMYETAKQLLRESVERAPIRIGCTTQRRSPRRTRKAHMSSTRSFGRKATSADSPGSGRVRCRIGSHRPS